MDPIRRGAGEPRSSSSPRAAQVARPEERRPAHEPPPAVRRRTEQGHVDVARPRVDASALGRAADVDRSGAGSAQVWDAVMPARRSELLHVEKLVEGLRRLRQGETRASVCASLKTYDLASAFDKHGQLLPRQAHMRAAAVHDKLESLQQGGGDGAAVVARLFDEIGRHREMALTRAATAMRILMEASELLRGPRAPTIVKAVEAVHAKFDTQYSKVSFEKALRATGELQCETFSFAKAIVNDARWLRDHGDDAHKELSDQWERFVADQRPRAVPVPRRPRPAFGIERRTRFVHALIEGLRRMQSGETFSAAALQSATLKRVFKSDGSFRPYGERFLAEVRSMPGGAALADQLVRESELALLSPHGEMARAVHAVAAIAHGIARIKEGQNKQQVEEELRAGAAAGLYGGVVHSKILHCAVRADGHSFMPGPHASALAKKVARLNPEKADHRQALDALRDAIRKNHPQPEIFASSDPLEDLLRLAGEDGRTKDRTRTSGPVGSASTPSPGVGPSRGAAGAQPSDENASDEDLEAVPTPDSSAQTSTSSGDDDAGGADELLDARAALHLELFGSSPEPASPPLREPLAGPSTAPVSLMSLRAALAGDTLVIKAEQGVAMPGAAQARPVVMVEHEVDQALSGFIAMEMGDRYVAGIGFDLIAPSESREIAYLERVQMEPVPSHDDEFPLRDPDDANRVYAPYAAIDGRCHPNVEVVAARIPRDMVDLLKVFGGRLTPPMGSLEVEHACDELRKDVTAEVDRLIHEKANAEPRCETRRITKEHIQGEHERGLVGGYGLFARLHEGEPPPTLRHGRILGLFSGAVIETPEQEAEHVRRYGEIVDYALDIDEPEDSRESATAPAHARDPERFKFLSPKGHTNAMAFANTALMPKGVLDPMKARRLFYDRGNLNATFVSVDVQLTDRDGLPRTERMMAVVALDKLLDTPSNPHAQVRLNYGDNYLPGLLARFKAAHARDQAAIETHRVKTEPAGEDDASGPDPRLTP